MGATSYLTLNIEKCSKASRSPGVSQCASRTRIEKFLESAQLSAYSKTAERSQVLLSTLLSSSSVVKSKALVRKNVFGNAKDDRYEIQNEGGQIAATV